MAELERLIVRIEADSTKLRAELGKIETTGRTAGKRLETAFTPLSRAFDTAGTRAALLARRLISLRSVIGTLAGTTGVGLLARRALENADALQDQADVLGINVEKLQALRFTASQTGAGVERMQTALEILSSNMTDAAEGTGSAVKAFHELQVPIKNLDGTLRAPNEILGELLDKLRAVPDAARRIGLARDIFGRSGASMLLLPGTAGLAEFEKQARATGQVMEEALVRKAAQANDQIEALGTSLSNAFNVGLIDSMASSFGTFSDMLKDPALRKAAEDLGHIFGTIAAGVANLAIAMSNFGANLRALDTLPGNTGPNTSMQDFDALVRQYMSQHPQVTRQNAEAVARLTLNRLGKQGNFATIERPAAVAGPSNVDPRSIPAPKTSGTTAEREAERLKEKLEELRQETYLIGTEARAMWMEFTDSERTDAAIRQNEAIKQSALDMWEAYKKGEQEARAALEEFAQGIGDAFAGAAEDVLSGRASILDAVNSLAADIQSQLTKSLISQPISDWIKNQIMSAAGTPSGGAGGGPLSFLTSLFSSGGSGLSASSSSAISAQAASNVGSMAIFHAGGMQGALGRIALPAFHGGGMAALPRMSRTLQPDEFLATLRRGETVRTREQEAMIGQRGRAISLTVNVAASAGMSARDARLIGKHAGVAAHRQLEELRTRGSV